MARPVPALAAPGEGPVRFSGPAHALKGELALSNPGAEPAELRDLVITLDDTDLSARSRVLVRLGPGETRQVPFVLSLGDSLPPGRYSGSLHSGETAVSAVFSVEPPAARPGSAEAIRVEGAAGTRTGPVEIELHNPGQEPLKVDPRGPVAVTEARQLPPPLPFLPPRELVASRHQAAVPVEIEGEPVEIPPGGTATLRLWLQLPETLLPDRLYIGRIERPGLRLSLHIHIPPSAEGAPS